MEKELLRKGFILIISNEEMNDINDVIKLLVDSNVLIDSTT